jgi:hypothetical protein
LISTTSNFDATIIRIQESKYLQVNTKYYFNRLKAADETVQRYYEILLEIAKKSFPRNPEMSYMDCQILQLKTDL